MRRCVRFRRTAGVAVLTSGLTVVVGFAALLLTPLVDPKRGLAAWSSWRWRWPSRPLSCRRSRGAGRQIDRPVGSLDDSPGTTPTAWGAGPSLSRHPRRALAIGGASIALLTAPVFWIRIGLPARNWWPDQTEAGQGVKALEAMGVSNMILPVRMVVEAPTGQTTVNATSLRGLRALSDSLRADPRIRQVRHRGPGPGTRSCNTPCSTATSQPPGRVSGPSGCLLEHGRQGRSHRRDPERHHLAPFRDGCLATSSRPGALPPQLKGAILVGGYRPNLDLQDLMLAQFPLLVFLIPACTGVMLAIAFRSVLVPIKAVIMNTLSVSATFGLITLVFQYGVGGKLLGLDGPTSAIFLIILVLVFAVVFGLSMDYEVFLLARVKEAFDRSGKNDQATEEGLSATASTITSAALIMILVFGVFAFARVLAMQFLGFGLAVAVLLDATIIRMVLVPAIMHLAGEWNWWPGGQRKRERGEGRRESGRRFRV